MKKTNCQKKDLSTNFRFPLTLDSVHIYKCIDCIKMVYIILFKNTCF